MIAIRNLTKTRVQEQKLKRLAEKVLRGEGSGKDLSLVVVGPTRMRQLNKTFRDKEHTANVLSFAGAGDELGEIVLCPSAIRKDAREYGITKESALAWMLVHGLLHLLGYSHTTAKKRRVMEERERRYLRAFDDYAQARIQNSE